MVCKVSILRITKTVVLYTVFRVGRITPHPDHRNLRKQAKKNLEPFSISPGSVIAGSQASYTQPMLNIIFFVIIQKNPKMSKKWSRYRILDFVAVRKVGSAQFLQMNCYFYCWGSICPQPPTKIYERNFSKQVLRIHYQIYVISIFTHPIPRVSATSLSIQQTIFSCVWKILSIKRYLKTEKSLKTM